MYKIRALRRERNIKQSDLAKYMKISPATLSNWENGLFEPDIKSIKKLAAYFKVPVDYLISDSDEYDTLQITANANPSPPKKKEKAAPLKREDALRIYDLLVDKLVKAGRIEPGHELTEKDVKVIAEELRLVAEIHKLDTLD